VSNLALGAEGENLCQSWSALSAKQIQAKLSPVLREVVAQDPRLTGKLSKLNACVTGMVAMIQQDAIALCVQQTDPSVVIANELITAIGICETSVGDGATTAQVLPSALDFSPSAVAAGARAVRGLR